MPARIVPQILESLNREVLNQLDLAGSIDHPGENGRAREQIVAAHLRRIVPAQFGIDTGFVLDATGGISKQVDLVIYRTGYHPVFEIGGIKHFPIEAVAAVIENKASIASTGILQAALANVASVKGLDRTNRGKNYVIGPGAGGAPTNADDFQHQVFGAIVTERSLATETFRQVVTDYLASSPRRIWPNIYADLRRFSFTYLSEVEPANATAIPSEAKYIAVTEPDTPGFVPPLLDLTFELLNFLRVAPVIDYKPTDYLFAGTGKIKWWKL